MATKPHALARGFTEWAFSIALGLLFILVLRALAAQISPPPEPITDPYPDVSTQEKCDIEGGRWIEQATGQKAVAPRAVVENEFTPYCQGPLAFERARDLQREKSQQTGLFVFAIGGTLAIAGALLVVLLQPVAPGLMLGGIVAFLISGFYVWTLAPGIGRLITIIGVFAVLVGIGLRVFKDTKD